MSKDKARLKKPKSWKTDKAHQGQTHGQGIVLTRTHNSHHPGHPRYNRIKDCILKRKNTKYATKETIGSD